MRLVAYALALLAIGAAVRTFLLEPAVTGDEFAASPHHPLLVRLTRGLLDLQGADGSFDAFPTEPDLPEVVRTVPHALACAALARADALGVARAIPELPASVARGLDILVGRQKPGGGFGGLAPSAGNPWPGVDAASAATLAFAIAGRPCDRTVLAGALSAVERAAAYELRDGWTRALAALALHAACSPDAEGRPGRDATSLLAVDAGEPGPEAGCRDEQVAEAIVRAARGLPGPYADDVAAACLAERPVWLGERSDVQAWWMQAWLVARDPGREAYFTALAEALEEALEGPPKGQVGGSWYADGVSQAACAVLAVAESVGPL
jgi:hypothetical protein